MGLRPTFMGFETAKAAIFTNQKAIDITLNNLSNIETNGYTRQRVDRASLAPASFASRVASSRVGLMGQGVEALGVSQMRDEFLDRRFREEYGKTSYHSQVADILSDIQSALGDGEDITDESGLYGAMKQMYDSINDFVQNSTSDSQAGLVFASFRNVVEVLQQLDAKLTNVAEQQITDLGITVDRINEIGQHLSEINKMIREDATVQCDPDNEYFRPNELLDERNLLLDELAGYGDISVKSNANGTIDVTFAGHDFIKETPEGTEVTGIGLNRNEDYTVKLSWRTDGKDVAPSTGAVRGYIDYINGRGSNIQNSTESIERGIYYYRDKINTYANEFAKVVNNAIPVYDPDTGEPAVDPITGETLYRTLVAAKMPDGTTNGNIPVTAGSISISDEWNNAGNGYFVYDRAEFVEDYAQQIVTALTEGSYTFKSFGGEFVGTFVDFEVDFLTTLGSDIAFQEGRRDSTAKVADDFLARRDEISGVSRDEETANAIQYQKSYEAAARMMTVLDELLDVIVNKMGRAGL